jgi:V8-like Glu-specific endopeptidase
MNYLIEQCLFPIIEGDECVGQGFVADSFFITAAHVVNDYPDSFIEIGDQRIILSKETPIYIGKGDIEKDPKTKDVAIYIFPNTHSFLHLSSRKIANTDYLRSFCIAFNYDRTTNEYHKDLHILEATLLEQEEGNYLYCKCNRYQGSSGSPLVVGNEVVGIMHSGDEKGLCAFLKPESFMYPEGEYNGCIIRWCSSPFPREEPLTPEYFNNRAREQVGDAFE